MPGGEGSPSGGGPGGMPGDAQAGGAGGEAGADGGSTTTGEGGAYGTVGSVGERAPGPGGATDVSGDGGGQGSLEDEFERSLGDFDDSLLEEQQKVAEVSRDTDAFESAGGGQGGGGGVVGLGEQAGESGEGSGGTVGVVNNSAGGAGGSIRQEPGSVDQLSKEQIGERTPEDIPSGVDDDIVAKQLREAALAEEDPELRERLWDEYRAYKGL
jgi:hypothetical protein